MTKIYDKAATAAFELKADLRKEFLRDGVLTNSEQYLLGLAEGVYAHTESAATSIRVGLRFIGGGALDERMLGAVKEAAQLIASAPTVPAQRARVTFRLHKKVASGVRGQKRQQNLDSKP